MNFKRHQNFQRNENLEIILKEINNLLESTEAKVIENHKQSQYPIILVVGCARSGSTLVMQWLAQTGYFAYPTNMLSRFYAAPYIGAKIQRMLTEFDYNQEIFDFNQEVPFSSNLGKTKGALAPNEFWYFWRRFFPDEQADYQYRLGLNAPEVKTFAAELAALEAVFDRPLALKGHIINWNIPFISNILEKVLFIYIKRHPFYNMQSLLEARVKYYGDQKAWYSFKPKEYPQLRDLDPFAQVAGQLYYTNRAIETGLNQVEPTKQIQIDYETFCTAPDQMFYKIIEKLQQQGYDTDWSYSGPDKFEINNQVHLSSEGCDKLIGAYQSISGLELTL